MGTSTFFASHLPQYLMNVTPSSLGSLARCYKRRQHQRRMLFQPAQHPRCHWMILITPPKSHPCHPHSRQPKLGRHRSNRPHFRHDLHCRVTFESRHQPQRFLRMLDGLSVQLLDRKWYRLWLTFDISVFLPWL